MVPQTRLHAELIGLLRQHSRFADQRHLVLLAWMVVGLLAAYVAATLIARHKSENRCDRTGLRSLGGQGAMRTWGYETNPIPSGIPCPAPC